MLCGGGCIGGAAQNPSAIRENMFGAGIMPGSRKKMQQNLKVAIQGRLKCRQVDPIALNMRFWLCLLFLNGLGSFKDRGRKKLS